jgi:signal transduction histidine kinase/ActR/RegA family two-component response regulator
MDGARAIVRRESRLERPRSLDRVTLITTQLEIRLWGADRQIVMPSRLRLGSAARLVALCAALTLVPLALLAYLSVRLASDAVEENARAQVRSNAALAVSVFQSGMSTLTGSLTTAAARPELQSAATGPDPDHIVLRRLLLELEDEQRTISTAFLTTAEGRLLAVVPEEAASLQGADLSDSDWYRGVTKTGEPYVSSAYRSEAPGDGNVVAVAVPVRPTGARGGSAPGSILVATFDLTATQQFVDYFSSSLGIELEVTDQRGVLLARPGQRQGGLVSVKDDAGVAAALRGESVFQERRSESGVSLAAHAPIPGIGWTVTASVPKRTAFAGVDRLRSSVVVVAGILALLLLGGLAVLARSLHQRVRAEAAAERARAEAELANRAKSEFLSRMSHELRTPLNAVLGFGQLLSMGELDDKEQESVDQILKGGQHLLGLINEILDIARIESGKLALSLEPVDVSETVREALDLVRPLAAERAIEIAVDRGVDDAYVVADRQRLSQVLLNLLSNSIKYNRPGGTVRIGVAARNGTTRIEVADSGEGIAAENFSRLFTPFDRLGADERQIDGTGLGLVLSKGLVEAMGGRLEAESRVGSGSTFRIELQTTASPVAAAEEEHHLPAEDARPAGDRRYTILYIEDNLSNLKLVERILGDRPDVHLIAAMQGGLGLELAREHRPDLVLLDLHLPDIQGDEVLARLQADPEFNGTPVIVLSADATKGRIQRLLDAGACAYLSKPIDVKQFVDLVNEHAPPSVLV